LFRYRCTKTSDDADTLSEILFALNLFILESPFLKFFEKKAATIR